MYVELLHRKHLVTEIYKYYIFHFEYHKSLYVHTWNENTPEHPKIQHIKTLATESNPARGILSSSR